MIRRAAILFVLLFVLIGCSDDDDTTEVIARSECRHFANVMVDMLEGYLTAEELREKMQEVERGLRGVEDAHPLARKALIAIERDDVVSIEYMGDLSDVCLTYLEPE